MKYIFTLLIGILVTLSGEAQHTFSIVAVDAVTGEIGSAGATCIAQEDGAQTISDIVLGKGAIHTQSYWHPTNQANARTRMEAGDSPSEIINWLVENDVFGDASTRQYGIVDLNNGNPRSAAHTGSSCFDEKIHKTGANYAIAGNILIDEAVVNDMETAFLSTTGSLADKLMAALQGAKRPGADSRCLEDGVSSTSAFIRVADPTDTNSSYGNLSLDLNIWVTSTIFEPIDELQEAYNASLSNSDYQTETETVVIAPNPVLNSVTVRSKDTMITSYKITDTTGKIIVNLKADKPKNILLLDLIGYSKGVYLLSLYNNDIEIAVKKILVD